MCAAIERHPEHLAEIGNDVVHQWHYGRCRTRSAQVVVVCIAIRRAFILAVMPRMFTRTDLGNAVVMPMGTHAMPGEREPEHQQEKSDDFSACRH